MAIEIFVTQKCKQKLRSKNKIISVKLKNEAQLNMFVNSNELMECEHISFYNFTPKSKYEQFIGVCQLNKFILYDNKKAGFKIIDCNTFLRHEYRSIYELVFDNFGYYGNDMKHGKVFNAFYLACAKAYTKFPDFKHCSLCKYYKFNDFYGEHICILYKQLGLKDKHEGKNAMVCQKYLLDKEFVDKSIGYFSELSVYEWEKNK